MILGLDIGNTSIVVGGLDESAIHFTAEFSTDLYKTSDEYAIMLKTVLEIHEIDRKGLEGAIIGTVVPALGEVLREAVRKVTGRKALLVGSGLKTGLNILIDSPAQAGSDLIVNALSFYSFEDFSKQLQTYNRRDYNQFPMRPLGWKSPQSPEKRITSRLSQPLSFTSLAEVGSHCN